MKNLAVVLKKWRRMSDMTLQQAAKAIGINHVTLHRIESGEMPSGETLKKVFLWLLK